MDFKFIALTTRPPLLLDNNCTVFVLCTVCVVHLAIIKFGELEKNGHLVWRIGEERKLVNTNLV